MHSRSAALAAIVLSAFAVLAGCVSQNTVESRPIGEESTSTVASAHRRAEVHTVLASEYFARGNFTVALSEVQLAIKDDPKYAQAYNMRGLVYMELREEASARGSFDRALDLAPDDPEVLNNFGWFLCTRGETDRAIPMLKRAAANPLYPTPEKAYLSLGLCYRRIHQDAEAEGSLARAVTIQPNLIGALYNLAVIKYEQARYKEAEGYLTRYMRLLQSPPLDGLVLGVKISRATRDGLAEQSYMLQLQRRFPDAPETLQLEKRP
ncbi:MAG TPA: type IV pilus biogenesis/stability protein PilW [Usitatibacter sp.]|nr:type IV pilus biogenesis/stability protein PilW [Usitatibacter sp.]